MPRTIIEVRERAAAIQRTALLQLRKHTSAHAAAVRSSFSSFRHEDLLNAFRLFAHLDPEDGTQLVCGEFEYIA